MRLKKIKLAGFKSFVDPTTIYFPSNLVGAVGPNGCGKSNVIDAVRWVMGESSAKFLRGESMADVIFNGSGSRKPVGQATLELVFDNADGSLGGQYAQYAEIAIKRTVSRDGQSIYYLNGSRCRRRDITDIFLGTGLGPRSYAIIEQGMVSRLIEARPEELRIFIEEAAGISRYKERRKETATRIAHTVENLTRLDDVRGELDKQLGRLQRQARTAARYKELKQEERGLKAELLALHWRAVEADRRRAEGELRAEETSLAAVLARQSTTEAEIGQGRLRHDQANDSMNQVQGRAYAIGADIARLEQAMEHARDRQARLGMELETASRELAAAETQLAGDQRRVEELGNRLAEQEPAREQAEALALASASALQEVEQQVHQWQSTWEDYTRRAAAPAQLAQVQRTRLEHLDRQGAQTRKRVERLDEELSGLSVERLSQEGDELALELTSWERRIEQMEATLQATLQAIDDVRRRNRELSATLDAGRQRLQAAQGRLASLQALQEAALGKDQRGVGAWLADHGIADAPRVAQEIRVEPGWERAVETVLGPYLEAVCVDAVEGLAARVGQLQDGNLALLQRHGAEDAPPREPHSPRLLDKLRCTLPLHSLLGGIYAVESLDQALALRSRLAAQESVVTRDGVWLGPHWLRVIRGEDTRSGVLARHQELGLLASGIATLGAEVEAGAAALEQGRAQLRTLEQQREQQQAESNAGHRRAAEVRAALGGKQARLEQMTQRGEHIRSELQDLRAHLAEDAEAEREARGQLSRALEEMETLAEQRSGLESERDGLRRARDEARDQAGRQRDESHRLALAIQSARTELDGALRGIQRLQSQIHQLAERRTALAAGIEEGHEPLAAMQRELDGHLDRRVSVDRELAEARAAAQAISEELRALERTRQEAFHEGQRLHGELERARGRLEGLKVRAQTIEERMAEQGGELGALLERLEPDAGESAWEQRLAELGRLIERLGPINLAAIEELETESERKQYLDAQHADLSEALATLEDAIGKLDRETRGRFQETFDKINGGLQTTFPRLFGGGNAYLELTGEDLLEAGVTIMARPPGKRNSTIHLLSGGEKALTAVALVFAIFELNPAPFCMLDEVDAPLDEANVGRFCELVQEMSQRVQFIFITHNKATMELAEHLIGVTMHEPGVSRLVEVDVDQAVELATA